VVSNDGGTVVSNDGATLVSHDSGTAVAIAVLVSHGGTSVISNDGGTLVGKTRGTASVESSFKPIGLMTMGIGLASTPVQPEFTGLMTVQGKYAQSPGAGLLIAIAGTNTVDTGAQQFDQLVVSREANLAGGLIAFGLFNPGGVTNQTGLFQPAAGDIFDVVVASKITVGKLAVRGPIWGEGLHFNWGVVTRTDGKQALRLVATPVPPRLSLVKTGPSLQLSYPTNYVGYLLQASSDLTPASWQLISTNQSFVVTPSDAYRYFRLTRPSR
jgi:hypothetical protein